MHWAVIWKSHHLYTNCSQTSNTHFNNSRSTVYSQSLTPKLLRSSRPSHPRKREGKGRGEKARVHHWLQPLPLLPTPHSSGPSAEFWSLPHPLTHPQCCMLTSIPGGLSATPVPDQRRHSAPSHHPEVRSSGTRWAWSEGLCVRPHAVASTHPGAPTIGSAEMGSRGTTEVRLVSLRPMPFSEPFGEEVTLESTGFPWSGKHQEPTRAAAKWYLGAQPWSLSSPGRWHR